MFNKRTLVVEESIHVILDESNPPSRKDSLDDDDDVGILQKKIFMRHHMKKRMIKKQSPLLNLKRKSFMIHKLWKKSLAFQERDFMSKMVRSLVIQTKR